MQLHYGGACMQRNNGLACFLLVLIAGEARITIYLHQGDVPEGVLGSGAIAVDTEAMGLNNKRDRLCLVQLSCGDGDAHLVQMAPPYNAPHLKALLEDPNRLKLFHFARFDVSIMQTYLQAWTAPIYCTRTASRLVRTYTDRHGLKELCRELLGVELSKQQQSSDWGAALLSPEQQAYAASDVLHLHALKDKLDVMLGREGRAELAQACFDFLPQRAALDVAGFEQDDIFAHA